MRQAQFRSPCLTFFFKIRPEMQWFKGMHYPAWFDDNQLNIFQGYGSPNPQVVFIGLEEGGCANGAARAGFGGTPDNPKPLVINAIDAVNFLEGHPTPLTQNQLPRNPTWRWISEVLKAAIPDPNLGDNDWFLNFGNAARENPGKHLLTELLPLPKMAFNLWPCEYRGQFLRGDQTPIATAEDFREEYFSGHDGDLNWIIRRQMLRRICEFASVRVVICYGTSDRIFEKYLFANAIEFEALPLQNGLNLPIRVGQLHSKPYFIVPHPTARGYRHKLQVREYLATQITNALDLHVPNPAQ